MRKLLPKNSAAIFFSSPERNRANDVYYEYHQDPNFYYLSGIIEPNSMIIIYKDKQKIEKEKINEMAFIQYKDKQTEVWNGRRLGLEAGQDSLGFQKVLLNINANTIDFKLSKLDQVFIETPYAMEGKDTSSYSNIDALVSLMHRQDVKSMNSNSKVLGSIMSTLRQKKTEEELVLLRKAIDITCLAQNKLMREINQEMTEYQTEAIIEYVFKSNGAEYTGFPSIQGSGENSCILHYTSNRRPLINGGLLVSDVGAEYHGYTADVTRTIPPDGKFSEEEALIYELVLKAQTEGIEQSIVGNSFWLPGMVATKVIAEGLVDLGIINDESEVRKYFMHGTSHHIGLDTHDYGALKTPMKPNMVFTVEPGIYIPEEQMGIRLEDDVVIQEAGKPFNLMQNIPIVAEEIEDLMNS